MVVDFFMCGQVECKCLREVWKLDWVQGELKAFDKRYNRLQSRAGFVMAQKSMFWNWFYPPFWNFNSKILSIKFENWRRKYCLRSQLNQVFISFCKFRVKIHQKSLHHTCHPLGFSIYAAFSVNRSNANDFSSRIFHFSSAFDFFRLRSEANKIDGETRDDRFWRIN